MDFQIFTQNRVVKHLLFWTAFIAAGTFSDYSKFDNYCFFEIFVYHLNDTFFGAIGAYIIAYYLLTERFLKKGYLNFGLSFIVIFYLLSALCRFSTVYIIEPLVRKPPFSQEPPLEILTDLSALFFKYGPSILTAAFIFYMAKFFSDHSKEREKKLLLSKEKSDAELKMLRSQLNPHFLFNTLNNIYSLSVDNSPKTSSAIGKLSEILDYVLYKCNTDFVPISAEMQLINDYIELEKLRYDERLEVHLDSSVAIENQVPPLIFLSLVENAFKHGAGEDSGSPKIWITLKSDTAKTEFKVVNTCATFIENQSKESIGLVNINKQLELLYGTSYSLQTKREKDLFSVTLILENKNTNEN
ncbi:histidine kinase [Flavobacterium sp.]|uniref:sensor histidine kinase n=1 Tax=Flavobacterium sp. TaxID=239 RepID=UPI0026388E3B|nr:histidine kinase [Flavobacterium sp.]